MGLHDIRSQVLTTTYVGLEVVDEEDETTYRKDTVICVGADLEHGNGIIYALYKHGIFNMANFIFKAEVIIGVKGLSEDVKVCRCHIVTVRGDICGTMAYIKDKAATDVPILVKVGREASRNRGRDATEASETQI